ncbi:MAG: hypothetical protein KC425_22750 [Anaerolineales bacterium]|nr:hypothetical protein [Anaerolineales bacterium]
MLGWFQRSWALTAVLEDARLAPAAVGPLDNAGWSVALDGDTAVVGVPSVGGPEAAVVFARDAQGSWVEQARLTPGSGVLASGFGLAVALDGDTAVIGAPHAAGKGAAYVFVRSADGSWLLQATLVGRDTDDGDQLGTAVIVAGDTVLIGAPNADVGTIRAGAVYAFKRDAAGAWAEQAKFSSSDYRTGDKFGCALAMSGPLVLVGAYYDDDGLGAAFVFAQDAGGNWVEQAKLTAGDTAVGDRFGHAVALSDATALVGAYRHNAGRGAVYVFTQDAGGSWQPQAKLTASDGGDEHKFGTSLTMQGNLAVIGAPYDGDGGNPTGSAYVFAQDGMGTWHERVRLAALDAQPGDNFGYAVALNGRALLVGAYGVDHPAAVDGGAAYLFTAPDVLVDVTPLGPTSVPAGGTFAYRVQLMNRTAVPLSVQAAVLGRAPGGAEVVLQGPVTLTLNPGEVKVQSFAQTLPPGFTGEFELVGQVVTAMTWVEDAVSYTVP